MFKFRQHLHYGSPLTGVSAMIPRRAHGNTDGGDGGGAGGGVPKMAPAMTQEAFDAIVRDAKEQAKRSVNKAITDKYGDLDDLKAKAAVSGDDDDPEIDKALEALFAVLVPDAPDGTGIKELLAKANPRLTELASMEKTQADAATLAVRQEALKTAGLNPELAKVLNLTGTTAEELATEITDKGLAAVVGATGTAPIVPKVPVPVGSGTNPAGGGTPAPSTLSEAIGAHYEVKK